MTNRLIELTDDNYKELIGNPIYCVRFYVDYLTELFEKYPELSIPEGAVESYERYQGVRNFKEYKIPIIRLDDLTEVPDDSIFLITSSEYEYEYEQLLKKGIPENACQTIYYFLNSNTRYYRDALLYYNGTELEDILVFRSGPPMKEMLEGLDFCDNSRALFEHLVNNGYTVKYKLVWFVKDAEKYRDIESSHNNVRFMNESDAVNIDENIRNEYYHYLCQAKFIFFTDASGFCRLKREGQVRVQLWHGCGFKDTTMKKKIEPAYELMPVTSKLYIEYHSRYFNLAPEKIIVTGYPKQDWLFHPVKGWREKLGVKQSGKLVLWLPTFRAVVAKRGYLSEPGIECETGIQLIHTREEALRLDKKLKELDIVLLIKLHPLQDRAKINLPEMENIFLLENTDLVRAGLEINHIMGDADGFMSDYSSAATDYLVLDRPLAFTVEDAEDFKGKRGFLFDNIEDYLPGKLLYTFDDMNEFVDEIASGVDSTKELRDTVGFKLNEFRDDKGSERLIKALGI